MGRILVLSDPLINRIAAGEVVDRPASVVKELVENSLDAGATSVGVTLEAGGKRSLRVDDDGFGMDRDDVLLALERHATSKLTSMDELETIRTFGFRGEALSSIAAVSRFLLSSATADGAGTEVEVHGGKILSVRDAGVPRGMSIRVERLFFNVPARRKFLRTEATELSHIVRWLTRCALAYPHQRFTLEHSGRRLLQADPTTDLDARLIQIYGREFADKLLPFEGTAQGMRVFGRAGRPVEALPRRDAQHLFVNGRSVQDRTLYHAVNEAYGNTMPRGRHPALFLFLELDPDLVDVNVHPQKTEVRFRRSGAVHDLVRDAVHSALAHQSAVPSYSDLRPTASVPAVAEAAREAGPDYLSGTGDSSPTSCSPAGADRRASTETGSFTATAIEPRVAEIQPSVPRLMDDVPGSTEGALRPLAQLRDSYILAEDGDGLVLVDQHAAHERVLFERYLAQSEQRAVEVQKLMFPVTVELAPHEFVLFEQELEQFHRLGFAVEPFGGTSVRLDGIPVHASSVAPEALFRELLGEAAKSRSVASDSAELRRLLITSAACQAAIKVHYHLAPGQMRQLLEDLAGVENPSTCPHGRPALFRLSMDEIERAFRRR